MAIVKLFENYSVGYLRQQVRDSLCYHGEECVALALVHTNEAATDPNVVRCPRCGDDAYNDGENDCPVCYGVNFIDVTTGSSVRVAHRVWALFTDRAAEESLGQKGVWAADAREIQLEAFPLLMEHDVIVRVKCWDMSTHTPLTFGEFYGVQAVTQNSLRTGGNRFSQTSSDVIGQKANCTLLSRSVGITNYPIQGVAFPDVTVEGTTVPVVVAQPDTRVVFYPVGVPRASEWFSGSGLPTTVPNAQVGDWYLDTDTGEVYEFSGVSGTGWADPTGPPTVVPGESTWGVTFTYTQDVPAAVWTIDHNFSHRPEVTVYVGDEVVLADVDAVTNPTAVTVTFALPQAGYAELS